MTRGDGASWGENMFQVYLLELRGMEGACRADPRPAAALGAICEMAFEKASNRFILQIHYRHSFVVARRSELRVSRHGRRCGRSFPRSLVGGRPCLSHKYFFVVNNK